MNDQDGKHIVTKINILKEEKEHLLSKLKEVEVQDQVMCYYDLGRYINAEHTNKIRMPSPTNIIVSKIKRLISITDVELYSALQELHRWAHE